MPSALTRAPEAERLTFIDDRGGVLIVSSSRVTPAESREVLDTLLSKAFAAVQRAASGPELMQMSELRESRHPSLRCWTAEARTRDNSVLFSQCVLASRRGVLLATLETPAPEQWHQKVFQSFVHSVGSAAVS